METSQESNGNSGGYKLVSRLDQNSVHNNNNRKQFSSFILFLSIIIVVNLCPFHSDYNYHHHYYNQEEPASAVGENNKYLSTYNTMDGISYMRHIETCFKFVKLMFTNPVRLGQRTTRFTQAEAKVLGKMAKMWYIKKKIKKLSKKLKKHTIAVPVFTAIPIYEHSYYPSPHVTHVSHGGGHMHHAAAASSYSPTVAQVTAPATSSSVSQSAHQMATSASNNHQQMATYARPMPGHHHHHHAMYHPMSAASAHQIINAYAPSPPMYVDEAGGLYGQYGNAYGRYDGGYHYW